MHDEPVVLRGRTYELLDVVSRAIGPHRTMTESKYESDVTFLGLTLGALLGFLASVAANHVPTIGELRGKKPLTRADLHEVISRLDRLDMVLSFGGKREAAVGAIAEALPAETQDRERAAQAVFAALKEELQPE